VNTSYTTEAGCGEEMSALIGDLYSICRSITGNGVRATLRELQRILPLSIVEVESGTRVFDWTVPNEWNITDAWIADASGQRIVDFRKSNLHVVSYSVPVHARMTLLELRSHLHTLPEQPDLIPYRTSYYKADWGFCLPHRVLEQMTDGDYEVCIDSTLRPGSLTYGELVLPGSTTDEILISTHVCHPSLANDNLSGIAVSAFLARQLASQERHHTFRFLFIPGTIGSITWLALHQDHIQSIRQGLVLSCLGDRGHVSYKRSRRRTALIDRAASHVLAQHGPHTIDDFVPYGYDERQYCSPGIDLPVGCLTRTPNGKYAQYHTSDDNLDFISAASLNDSLATLLEIIEVLEHNRTYVTMNPMCEPQLGRRGLYKNTGGSSPKEFEMSLLWVLNFSDGTHSLLDIAERASLPFAVVRSAAEALGKAELLRPLSHSLAHRGSIDRSTALRPAKVRRR
jgi:aminopeptidase-like protein